MAACAVLGMMPDFKTDLVCYVLFAVIVGGQFLTTRRAKAQEMK